MVATLTDAEIAELQKVIQDWRATHAPVSAFSTDLQSAFSKLAMPVSPKNTSGGANAGTQIKVKGVDR